MTQQEEKGSGEGGEVQNQPVCLPGKTLFFFSSSESETWKEKLVHLSLQKTSLFSTRLLRLDLLSSMFLLCVVRCFRFFLLLFLDCKESSKRNRNKQ